MKIKIKVNIKNKEQNLTNNYNAIYIKDKRIIKYIEDTKTNVTLYLKDNILVRENNNMYMKYNFINNKISENELRLKKMNKSIKLKLETKSIKNNKKEYEVKYKLLDSNETFIYKLLMEDNHEYN